MSACNCSGAKRVRIARDKEVEPADEQPSGRCAPLAPQRPAPAGSAHWPVEVEPAPREAGAQSLSLGAWYSLEERQESSQSELASRSQLTAELQLAARVTGAPPSGSILTSPADRNRIRIINRMASTGHSYATTEYSYSYMHL